MKSFKSVIILFATLLIFAFPTGTWAHSTLQSSIPAADAKVTEAVQDLSLTFNEKIDPTLSTLSIKNDQGTKIETKGVKVEENLLKASLAEPLESGSYTIEWKIVGGDGHPVKGTYAFQVEAPTETPIEAPIEAPDQEDSNATPAPSNTDNAAATDNTSEVQPQASPNADQSGSSNALWIVLIIAIAIIGVFFVLKQSRKRR